MIGTVATRVAKGLGAALRRHHPALFAACFALQLALRNRELIEPDEVMVPLLAVVALAVGLSAGAGRALRSSAAGAIFASFAVYLFLSGGEAQRWLAERSGAPIGRFTAAAVLWGALVLALLLLWRTVLRHPTRVERVTTVLSVMAALLLGNLLVRGGEAYTSGASWAVPAGADSPLSRAAGAPESSDRPDVYFIIADAYARDDVLRRQYGFDNSEFLAALEARGFYVAQRATSNYAMTFMSLAGTLNMEYVHETTQLDKAATSQRVQRGDFYRRIRDNRVAREFQARGYRFVQVLTHWGGTDRSDIADVVYRLPGSSVGEFASALANASLLRAFTPRSSDQHRFAFETAAQIPELAGPTFAFVHVLLPHSPFLYDAEGGIVRDPPRLIEFASERRAWADRAGYVGQLRYTNRKLLELMDAIIARSTVDPIIILAGDHGTSNSMFDPGRPADSPPLPEERLAVLAAFRVPAAVRGALYPEISSVNTFRVLLSAQFGADLPLLPDRNLFSYYFAVDVPLDVTARLSAVPAAGESDRRTP